MCVCLSSPARITDRPVAHYTDFATFFSADEEPETPEILIKTEEVSIEQAVHIITQYLREHKLINY